MAYMRIVDPNHSKIPDAGIPQDRMIHTLQTTLNDTQLPAVAAYCLLPQPLTGTGGQAKETLLLSAWMRHIMEVSRVLHVVLQVRRKAMHHVKMHCLSSAYRHHLDVQGRPRSKRGLSAIVILSAAFGAIALSLEAG